MKNYCPSFVVILFVFSLLSCSTNQEQNDLQKMNLKGDVILIKEGPYFTFFDENGNISKSFSDVTTEYNNRKFTNQSIANYFYIDGKLDKKINYDYNSVDDEVTEGLETFSYDEEGLLRSSTYKKGEWESTKYIFYEDGRLSKDSTFGGQKTDFFWINRDVNLYIYEGEELKKIENSRQFFSSAKELELDNSDVIHSNSYLDQGLVIKSEFLDADDSDPETSTYEYQKDLKGNWTKQTRKSSNKDYNNTIERQIFYSGDDISVFENKYESLKNKLLGGTTSSKENRPEEEQESVYMGATEEEYTSNEPSKPQPQKCWKCNGTGKCPKCSVPQRVRYKKGEAPRDHNEIRLGMVVCTQCGGNTMNWGHDEDESCYLCKATGWLYCQTCNSYGNGRNIGQCQECDGTGFRN